MNRCGMAGGDLNERIALFLEPRPHRSLPVEEVSASDQEMYHSDTAVEAQRGGVLEHGNIGLPGGLEPERLIQTAARHGARNVRVFGSVARGTATEGSDLDLLVEFDPGRNLFDLVGLKQEIEEALGGGSKVGVVTENALPPRLRERVVREAVSL